MVCDVCVNVFLVDPNSTSDENNILECIQCNVKVHQMCYGVELFSSNWLCDFCSTNDDKVVMICELCPKLGGPLKQTTSEKWVHVICALFTSHVSINDPATMSPIDVGGISKRSYKLSCYLCEKTGNKGSGACVKCFVTRCKRHLHITCGQSAQTLLEKLSLKGNLLFIAYCEDHVEKKGPSIPINSISTMLRDRKKINDNDRAKVKNATWISQKLPPVSIFQYFAVYIRLFVTSLISVCILMFNFCLIRFQVLQIRKPKNQAIFFNTAIR